YSSFAFDLTPDLRFGNRKNVLLVRLSPEDHSSRWYPGAGIYRNVWLDVTGPVHVAEWGTYVTTPQISDENAMVSIETQVRNHLEADVKVVLRTSILDASGKVLSKIDREPTTIGAGAVHTIAANLNLSKPNRWDIDNPYLYTLISELIEGNRVIDKYSTS